MYREGTVGQAPAPKNLQSDIQFNKGAGGGEVQGEIYGMDHLGSDLQRQHCFLLSRHTSHGSTPDFLVNMARAASLSLRSELFRGKKWKGPELCSTVTVWLGFPATGGCEGAEAVGVNNE